MTRQIKTKYVLVSCIVMCLIAVAFGSRMTLAQGDVPAVTGNTRVDKLLSQMTLAEKLTPIRDGREDLGMYQGQAGYMGGVPRLGIPGLRLADGPPGVLTRHPSQAETATMGVAATFDVRLAQQNGVVIGREARALGIDVSLQPFINIDRDLAFRRAYNTFGEDPLLTGDVLMFAGETKRIILHVAPRQLQYWSTVSGRWADRRSYHRVLNSDQPIANACMASSLVA